LPAKKLFEQEFKGFDENVLINSRTILYIQIPPKVRRQIYKLSKKVQSRIWG